MELFLASVVANWINLRKKQLETSHIYKVECNENIRKDWKGLVEEVLTASPHKYSMLEFFDFHGHLQTVATVVTRSVATLMKEYVWTSSRTVYERELVRLSDGGTIALDWARDPNDDHFTKHSNKPIVFMVHGLLGDSGSDYLYHFARELLDAGYQPVAFVARGCGGLKLTSPSLFSAKIPIDLVEAIHHIEVNYDHSSDHHQRKIFAVGYSLGAASLMQYLSLCKGFNTRVSAAVCVSPPWSFTNHAYYSGFISTIWGLYMMIPMRLHYLLHHNTLVELAPEAYSQITFWKICNAYIFFKYDSTLINNYHKIDKSCIYETECKKMAARQPPSSQAKRYKDIDEYYESINADSFVHDISVPTLVISGEDDPICRHDWSVAPEKFSNEMMLIKTPFGGHVCFPERHWWTRSWTDSIVRTLFDKLLQEPQRIEKHQVVDSVEWH